MQEMRSMIPLRRNLVEIKRVYKYFDTNKGWIIALFYVCAIVKDSIWYSAFGVNILNFITFQDLFNSFLSHTITLIILALTFLMIQIIVPNKNTLVYVAKFLFMAVMGIVYFILFKKFVSLVELFYLVAVFYTSYMEKDYILILVTAVFFVIVLSTIEPLIQAFAAKSPHNEVPRPGQFLWNESNMDYYSFTYNGLIINTKLEKYVLVGNSIEYFFVFDKDLNQTLIIQKSKCENIKSEFSFF